MGDTDEDIDTTEIEEDWIEYLQRSTRPAQEKMRTVNIPCWIVTHKKMKWTLAMRISTQPETKDGQKTKQNGIHVSAVAARQTELCEDQERDGKFLMPQETEETQGIDLKNNDTWKRVAKDQVRWKHMDNLHEATIRKE